MIQLPGISGTDNNLLMFEYSKNDTDHLEKVIENFNLITSVDFDVIILGSTERGYGFKHEIHIWITGNDYDNASLMILLGYIIMGHKEWRRGVIKIFALFPEETCNEEKDKLFQLIEDGQLPISRNNIEVIPRKLDVETSTIINKKSQDADLTIVGFRGELLKKEGRSIFEKLDGVGNTLFVNAVDEKEIK